MNVRSFVTAATFQCGPGMRQHRKHKPGGKTKAPDSCSDGVTEIPDKLDPDARCGSTFAYGTVRRIFRHSLAPQSIAACASAGREFLPGRATVQSRRWRRRDPYRQVDGFHFNDMASTFLIWFTFSRSSAWKQTGCTAVDPAGSGRPTRATNGQGQSAGGGR